MVQNNLFTPRRIRQIVSLAVATLLIGSVTYLGVQRYHDSQAATGGVMSLNPASDTVTPGSVVSVTIRADSGSELVNTVQSSLIYNPDQLKFDSKVEGTAFPIVAANSIDNPPGVFRIARATKTPVSGDNAVLTVNFKVLASSGSMNISIDKDYSYIVRSADGTDMLEVANGATYTVDAPSEGIQPVFSLTPSTGTFVKDDVVSVAVRVNSPDVALVTVRPEITYPNDKLEYVDTIEGGIFETEQRTEVNNGLISIVRGVAGGSAGVAGDNLIVTIRFKVLDASGSAVLGFGPYSAARAAADPGKNLLNLAGSTGSTYTLNESTPPPPPPPPGPEPNPPTPPNPDPDPTPPPPVDPDPTPPTPPGAGGSGGGVPISTPSGNISIDPTPPAGSASLNGSDTEITGEVELEPIVDPGTSGDSINKVEYYLNKKLVTTKTSAPFVYTFNTTKLRNGTYDMMIKTYYKNSTVDTTTDKLIVKNPVTLSYVLKHYLLQILTLLVALVILGILVRKLLPRLRGGGAAGSGGGYVYDDQDRGGVVSSNVAPDPTVVTPNSLTIDGPSQSPPSSGLNTPSLDEPAGPTVEPRQDGPDDNVIKPSQPSGSTSPQ